MDREGGIQDEEGPEMGIEESPGYVPGFEDVRSIRDLGGWQCADGRTVTRGLFYRGASLTDLTKTERTRIADLHLASILDLRAGGERALSPAWVPDGATYHHVSGMYDKTGREVDFSPAGIGRLQADIATDPEHLMENLYASMAHDNPALKRLVDIVRKDELPVYFHCTAGKDRTGVAAATIYVLLGADDDTIVREFLLTNDYRASIINMAPDELPPDTPDDLRHRWAQINGVNASCLRAFFQAIDERHPTREAWLEDEFGLTAPEIEAVRDRCLA